MPAHHKIKCLAPYFDAAARGEKMFEVRLNDRAYQCGDLVTLTRVEDKNQTTPWAPTPPAAPPALTFQVGFVLMGDEFGLKPGHVAFSLHKVPVQ